jgi:hypothetical protein
MKAKILIYADPHPIRNTYTEFATPARMMCKIASLNNFDGNDWKIFSNNYILDELTELNNENIIRPTSSESKDIESFLAEWTDISIKERGEFLTSGSHYGQLYYDILKRIHSEYAFTHIILWSENWAVQRYCNDNGLRAIHLELGPTRPPFQETLYVDPFGTNGNNFLSGIDCLSFIKKERHSIEAWTHYPPDSEQAPHVSALRNVPLSKDFSHLYEQRYALVALQLADDLNTTLNSNFSTPKAFLEFIVPTLIKLGYHVIVKGHPGASIRPVNLVHETEALKFAEEFQDQVTILGRDMPQKEFLPILQNAQIALSINSSISFEAWLLGVPGLVFGQASFDPNSSLLNSSRNFLKTGLVETRFPTEAMPFLLKNYFLPNEPGYLSKVLSKLIKNFGPRQTREDYLHWISSNIDNFTADVEEIKRKTTRNIKVRDLLETAKVEADRYTFHLDSFNFSHGKIDLRGWAGRTYNVNPHPLDVAVFYDDKPIAIQAFTLRPDVTAVYQDISPLCGFNLSVPHSGPFLEELLRVAVVEEGHAAFLPMLGATEELPKAPSRSISSRIWCKVKRVLNH